MFWGGGLARAPNKTGHGSGFWGGGVHPGTPTYKAQGDAHDVVVVVVVVVTFVIMTVYQTRWPPERRTPDKGAGAPTGGAGPPGR